MTNLHVQWPSPQVSKLNHGCENKRQYQNDIVPMFLVVIRKALVKYVSIKKV